MFRAHVLIIRRSELHYIDKLPIIISDECTGRFIMNSVITKIYCKKMLGLVFTKPVQIEGTNHKLTETEWLC